MICTTCHGDGVVATAQDQNGYPIRFEPCSDCGGCGVGHCSDGIDMPEPPTHESDK